jgi:hypothetical protein
MSNNLNKKQRDGAYERAADDEPVMELCMACGEMQYEPKSVFDEKQKRIAGGIGRFRSPRLPRGVRWCEPCATMEDFPFANRLPSKMEINEWNNRRSNRTRRKQGEGGPS